MKLIGFTTFKEYCNELDRDYDFEKDVCRHGGHEVEALFTTHPETKKKYYYHPCKQKYCPVFQCLKDGGK